MNVFNFSDTLYPIWQKANAEGAMKKIKYFPHFRRGSFRPPIQACFKVIVDLVCGENVSVLTQDAKVFKKCLQEALNLLRKEDVLQINDDVLDGVNIYEYARNAPLPRKSSSRIDELTRDAIRNDCRVTREDKNVRSSFRKVRSNRHGDGEDTDSSRVLNQNEEESIHHSPDPSHDTDVAARDKKMDAPSYIPRLAWKRER